jgi:hypothetical protein
MAQREKDNLFTNLNKPNSAPVRRRTAPHRGTQRRRPKSPPSVVPPPATTARGATGKSPKGVAAAELLGIHGCNCGAHFSHQKRVWQARMTASAPRCGGVADGSDLGSARMDFVLCITISMTLVGNQRGFWPRPAA